MTLFALDLNAGRARAMCGLPGTPRPVALDGTERELPLALSLESRRIEVGRAGRDLCRRQPHLACLEFLPHLAAPRTWSAGKHRLDATRAMTLVMERIQPTCAGINGIALALPAYLERLQVGLLASVLAKQRLPLVGSVSVPLAAAWSAHASQPWCGLALVLDADDHALTCTALAADEPANPQVARVLLTKMFPKLGLRAWKERLLDAIADRCVRQSRRDPRESAVAEQGLFDQFDAVFDACRQGEMVELVIQAAHWYQNLFLPPQEVQAFVVRLVRQTVAEVKSLIGAVHSDGPPAVVLVTASAAGLPGLMAALHEHTGEPTTVLMLADDAIARATHELAAQWRGNKTPSGHHDVAIPLRKTARPVRQSRVVSALDDDYQMTVEEE
ncbi:MAG: hypothetical protein K2R98_26855 [Gemmataceae bacterium]|nr:hypothetical protein [Gemmataceae bacterium]